MAPLYQRLLPMSSFPQFLVIDFHAESRYLLVKTLVRKYPGAVVHECDDAEKSVALARAVNFRAIITHRTFDVAGVELVKLLRNADPHVPIVMVSGIDREAEVLVAGANAFLLYDEWLRLGVVVEQVVARAPRKSTDATEVA